MSHQGGPAGHAAHVRSAQGRAQLLGSRRWQPQVCLAGTASCGSPCLGVPGIRSGKRLCPRPSAPPSSTTSTSPAHFQRHGYLHHFGACIVPVEVYASDRSWGWAFRFPGQKPIASEIQFVVLFGEMMQKYTKMKIRRIKTPARTDRIFTDASYGTKARHSMTSGSSPSFGPQPGAQASACPVMCRKTLTCSSRTSSRAGPWTHPTLPNSRRVGLCKVGDLSRTRS